MSGIDFSTGIARQLDWWHGNGRRD